MSSSSRRRFLFGLLALAPALGFWLFLTNARLHRVDAVTNLVETDVAIDPASPTGYAGGLRNLIVPGHNNESSQWIIQTQQMLAPGGDWRIREVRYDNAPVGRTVLTPSPFRWWLGLLAEIDHWVSGRPVGISVERAARISGPVLQLLLLVGATAFVAWRFGLWAAGLVSTALATLFPFGGSFLPGQSTDGSLILVCLSASGVLLLAGLSPGRSAGASSIGSVPLANPAAPWWFLAAGLAGGISLWLNPLRSAPIIGGIGLGGLLIAWRAHRGRQSDVTASLLPWRYWALGGAVTTLATYLLEYSPQHLGRLDLRVVNPFYGLAWIGLGEVLTRFDRCLLPGGTRRDRRVLAAVSAAVVTLIVTPVVLHATGAYDLFTADPDAARLTNLVGGPIAENFWTWLRNDGVTLTFFASCLPALLVIVAAALLLRPATGDLPAGAIATAFGPAFVMLGVSCAQLRSWNEFGATIPSLLIALTAFVNRAPTAKFVRAMGIAGMFLVLVPGALLLTREARADRHAPATELEVTALIERDLAHWLARQAGPDGAIVLAPPNLTMALIYHGGLSGLGTPFPDNKAGFLASMRIAGAPSADEAQAVAQARSLGYIVMPSWDTFLDEYAPQGTADAPKTLWGFLRTWRPPRWLRPMPYHLPQVAGFEEQAVAVFRITELQDNATALSRLAEYFVEMGMMREAAAVALALERSYPADLGAAVARTLVARAARDPQAFGRAIDDVQAGLARDEAENLTWDRRVSLAIALVDGDCLEQAQEEVKHCLAEIDEDQLRSLTTVSLHRLLVMTRTFGLKIDNPQIYLLAQQLLPPEMRDRR
ncbi:hypothetical protein Oter_3200 [Opitutus terrae PB90-1]|uniref:Uncharacterized protein n=2 Tax=Opitutus terrae TaxID=107709 RepID=B1ZN28_OPITP|nr:hypothetical protein Oter_3200 [Opitutus terrae PB90-1]